MLVNEMLLLHYLDLYVESQLMKLILHHALKCSLIDMCHRLR